MLNWVSLGCHFGVNLGANTDVGGYIMAGTIVDTGVGSVVEGNIYSGTTANTSGISLVKGDIEPGGKFKISAFAKVNGVITDFLANNSQLKKQDAQLGVVQETLRLLGVGNSTALGIEFDNVNEKLTSGIYDSLDYLTIRAGNTFTLYNENKGGGLSF